MTDRTVQPESPAGAESPITAAQRRALFAAGRVHGLGIDDLRAITPGGSISALTWRQAADLLKRLNAGGEYEHPRPARRGPRRPKGIHAMATDAQHRKIEALRIDLDWSSERLAEWLSERHHRDGRPLTKIDSTADANDVIELLKAVLARTERAATNRQLATGNRKPRN